MITKERLQELIKQCATIWTDEYRGSHFKIKLTKHFVAKLGDSFDLYGYGCDYFGIPLNHLFETEEEAEWHKEFGCIERTERLELPTWEEFGQSEKLIRFIGKFGQKCKIDGYFNLDLQSGFIDVTENGSSRINLPEYNKENYILACRKAKELFLGENK